MDGTQDTSDNDMSFEFTGPAIVIPSKGSPKRDFTAFSNDVYSGPGERYGRPAFNGNINQQPPTIHRHSTHRLQQEDAPSWMHWGFYRAIETAHFSCAILQTVYAATVMAAVAVAPTKRRLVSFTQGHPLSTPVRRLLWPRRRFPRIFRQLPSTSLGHSSTTPITPSNSRPTPPSPFHVPGKFPISPSMTPGNMHANPTSAATVIAAVSPTSEPVDDTISRESHLNNPIVSRNNSINDTTSLASDHSGDAPSWKYNRPSPPKYTHASVQELQGIREMFCRTTEEGGQAATELFKPTRFSSPVLARQGEATSTSTTSAATSRDGFLKTQTVSSVPIQQQEATMPLKSSTVISTDHLTKSAQSSPPTSTTQGKAGTSREDRRPTSRGRWIESGPYLSPASVSPSEVTPPLKSSIAESGRLAKTKPPHTPPSKGWIHQLVSSVKIKKRASPLREIHNGANERQMKILKNARFSENPVSATKRFVKNETISYPSPISSRDEHSILTQTSSLDILQTSPTQQEQDTMIADQLTGSMPGMSLYTTETACESDIGSSPATNNDHSTRPDPHSSDGSESGRKLLTEDETTRQTTAANHHRSESPASQPNDDDEPSQKSPAECEASCQVKPTLTKTRDFNPSTPSKLDEAFENLTVSGRRSSRRTQEKQELLEKRRLEQEAIVAERKARKDKAEAEEKARKQAEEEEERKKYARRMPIEKVIQPLTEKWENSVTAALAQAPTKPVALTIKGTEILRRDIGFVLPQRGAGDDPRGYLNDAIIEAYLLAIVDRGNRTAGHKRGETPKVHAFNNFFYDNLKAHGPERVKRWASKAKIGGKDLLKAEWIFIPICESLHWTLLVVSGTRKTIEYFDSLNMYVGRQIEVVKKWLTSELGSGYKDHEWKVVEDPHYPGRGKGPHQNNGSDCGVFAITTAKMISLGIDPMAILPTDMVTQRRRLIAELINGGFTDDFEPKIVFE